MSSALNVHDYQAAVGVMAIGDETSKRVAVVPVGFLDVTQYVRVDNCSAYDAYTSGSFCVCNSYSNQTCNSAPASNSTNGTDNSTNSITNSTGNSTTNNTETNSTTSTTNSEEGSGGGIPVFALAGAGVGASKGGGM